MVFILYYKFVTYMVISLSKILNMLLYDSKLVTTRKESLILNRGFYITYV